MIKIKDLTLRLYFTRRRVFPVGQTRVNGLPTEGKTHIYERSHSQERQELKEIKPQEVYRMMINLQGMDRETAQRYVLSMRLYHSAIEMMYSEPEFAYLFLVMSVEAIASRVYADLKPSDKAEPGDVDHYLNSSFPGWQKYCDISTPQKKEQVVNMLLKESYFVRRKFRKFITENLPETFWSETEDDAKPDYVYSVIGPGPNGHGKEYFHHSDKTTQNWEKIEKVNLKDTLDKIYSARARFVHEGVKFPASIVVGHFRHIPSEAFHEMLNAQSLDSARQEVFLDVPPLLTFERMVNYSLIGFLRKQGNN